MKTKQWISIIGALVKQERYIDKVTNLDKNTCACLEGEIIRKVHSIEKGLSLGTPRKFFGISKITEMISMTTRYKEYPDAKQDILLMVSDAIGAYLDFHKFEIDDERLSGIVEFYNNFAINHTQQFEYGGTQTVRYHFDDKDYDSLSEIVNSRHSVRDFSGEEVPIRLLNKALQLAFRCPTACNRQGIRAYVIGGKRKEEMQFWLTGIGGFAEQVDKYILITGKLSVYRASEAYQFQYAVTASIFAGYLSLALQSLGIGACLIQRPLVRTKEWIKLSKKFEIPEDEQIVLLIGTGMLKEEYKVPVSNRIKFEEMVRYLCE